MNTDDVEFHEAELVFQHDTYYVCMREAKGVTLSIEAERKIDGCRWRGDFTSRYIEEITQRVGNLKSFKTFVEMLKCATLRKSTALHVDLLTYHDLEKLTVRRGADDSHSTHSSRTLASDKRYLILTYVTEFDRVHYPLPLIYEEIADPEALKRCIQRLRSELDYMKAQLRKNETNNPPSSNIAAGDTDQNSNTSHGGLARVRGGDPTDHDSRGCSLDELTANKRTIMKLMKKNSILIDELRRAKEAEQRMSTKLQDQAFEIGLLKRRLSMRGISDVSPGPHRSIRDISPIRGRPRLPPQSPSPSRPRLAKSPSFETRSATRQLTSPSPSQQGSRSSSSLPGSRSSSCPGFRSKSGSLEYNTGEKPRSHPKPFSTRVTALLPKDARDFGRDRSPRPFNTRVPRSFSSSSQDSSDNFRAKLLSPNRANYERADKSNRRISPRPRSMHALSVEVEEIDSRLYALYNYLKSSHGK